MFDFQYFQNPDLTLLQKKRYSNPDVDEEDLIEIATEAFVRELGLDDATFLIGRVEIREVSAGTYLMKEDSNKVNITETSEIINTIQNRNHIVILKLNSN